MEKDILEKITGFDNVSFGKFNVDKYNEFASKLPFKTVENQPTTVFFVEGEPVDGFIGIKTGTFVKEKILEIQKRQKMEEKLKSGEINFIEAYDFTLADLDGNEITLSELNSLIILDFWATWCPPCKEEIPYLQKFYDEYKDRGLKIVGITSDSREKVIQFREKQKMNDIPMSYTLLIDSKNKVAKKYGIRSIPTSYFISPQGKLLKKEVGFNKEVLPEFRKIIEENLPE